MSKFSYLLVSAATLAAQVVSPVPMGTTATAQAQASSIATGINQNTAKMIYDGATTGPTVVHPNFDNEVAAPLKAVQNAKAKAIAEAEAARLAAIAKAKLVVKTVTPIIGAVTNDAWYGLRLCESGNTYNRNSGNGYYGAYQYNIGTWANYGGYVRPDLAPPAVQDAKARETQAARGWSPWPACSRQLGLM